jgi:hypothetical protein
MPWIIDYATVLERLQAEGLQCNYFNSGAFGFPPEAGAQVRGWIGAPDSTIKPIALELARSVPAPYEQTLAALASKAWQEHLPGNVWVMPGSHWSYELNHGSREWIPGLLERLEVDPGLLSGRVNAAALEFSSEEAGKLQLFLERLLQMLTGSDFFMVFPKRGTVCTLHHHKQLWWTTIDSRVLAGLDLLVK